MLVVNVNIWRESSSVGSVCNAARVTESVISQVEWSTTSWIVWRASQEWDANTWSWRDSTSAAWTTATDDVNMSAGTRSSVTTSCWPVVWSQSQSHCILIPTRLCHLSQSVWLHSVQIDASTSTGYLFKWSLYEWNVQQAHWYSTSTCPSMGYLYKWRALVSLVLV